MFNVAYFLLTEGKTPEQLEEIDDVLEGRERQKELAALALLGEVTEVPSSRV